MRLRVMGLRGAMRAGRTSGARGGGGACQGGADPLEPLTHLVPELAPADRALQLVPHAQNLVRREAARGEDHGAVEIREGAGDDLSGVVGVPNVEVALDVDGGTVAGRDDLSEQAEIRPTLHSALEPVEAMKLPRGGRGGKS